MIAKYGRLGAWAAGGLMAVALMSGGARAQDRTASLHVFPATWTTDEGASARLSDWKGKKVVMAMFYGSCHGSCPMIIQKLRKVETLFEENGVKASFVLVTFDPANDKPKTLRAYRERTGLTSPNWTMLTGADEDVRRLAMLLEVKYRKNSESGEIMHDNKIVLLSEDGQVLRSLQGLSDKESDLLPR
jgi:protein SCO1/2